MGLRKAIAVHHTATVDDYWDGPANEARLSNDDSGKVYVEAYAWYDAEAPDPDDDGYPDRKKDFKFIHHEVGADGKVGAANVRACTNAIAVLNGARGGADIPDSDRQGVYNHLAAHIKDAGMTPPELKSLRSRPMPERRVFNLTEVRVVPAADGEPSKLTGHAAVFNSLSEVLWDFREKIQPGAFSKTLSDGADVRALWNHNPDYVLGRTKSRTLSLAEDGTGLAVEILPPDTQWARDLMTTIERGDVDQMSFGFETVRDAWSTDPDGMLIRDLIECKLFDVSPVTFPAYPDTDVQARSLVHQARSLGIDIERLAHVAARSRHGIELRDEDHRFIRTAVDQLNSYLPGAPGQGPHPPEGDQGSRTRHLASLQRELDLVEVG